MKIGTFAWCLILLLGVQIFPALADEINLKVPTSYVSVAEDAQGNASFLGKNVQYLNQSGEPAIPYDVIRVLLPPDADLSTVTASVRNERIEIVPGQWNVLPMPPMAYWDGSMVITEWPEGKRIAAGRDIHIYEKDAFFPASHIGFINTGQKRDRKLAEISIALYQYNPVTQELYRLVEADLVLTFSRNSAMLYAPALRKSLTDWTEYENSKQFTENIKEVTPSYQLMATDPVAGKPANRYVIITTNEIQSGSNELENFIHSKAQRGFNVEVVTEDHWGGGTGDTAADNIRAWLQTNYQSPRIEYVLLIGDPDPALGEVPMKTLWPLNDPARNRNFPSDFYFADLTGNWDLDGDGFCGEWEDDFGAGGVDRYWEVLVGRIPFYGDFGDLDGILSKIIDYENPVCGDITWRKNVLLPMKPSDANTPGYHLGEAIKADIIVPKGDWEYHRVYEEAYGLNPPPETTPCTEDNVSEAWNGSPMGGVFWFTHGGPRNANGVMDLVHAATLDDTHPAFTFQASCSNATPEDDMNLAYSLLINGCIATVGSTGICHYYSGQTRFAGSDTITGMSYEYARRLIGDGMDCGHALHALRQHIVPRDWGGWRNLLVFNIYGDPSVALFPYIPGLALVINVPAGDVDGLKAAIRKANGTSFGAAIKLEPGTYTVSTVDSYMDGPNGLPSIGSPVSIEGVSPETTLIERYAEAPQFRLFHVASGGNLTLDGVTIQGGDVNSWGAGIYNRGTLTITNCAFLENKARSPEEPGRQRGGAILNHEFSLATITNSTFSSNHAGASGGGIYNFKSSPIIANCDFLGNEASGSGGGISNSDSASPTITLCSFRDNLADWGGAVCNYKSSPIISKCNFSHNRAVPTHRGGGIFNNRSFPKIAECIFSNNYASWGGGAISEYESSSAVINCTFFKNDADNRGGAFFNLHSSSTITNCTFANNAAPIGGAITNEDSSPIITNCILWQDVADSWQEIWNAFSSNPAISCCNIDQYGFAGSDKNIRQDPLFVDPENGDFRLQVNSPCIDTGTDTAPQLSNGDFDGGPRVLDGDGDGTAVVDMGAYEYSNDIRLFTPDEGEVLPAGSVCTVRWAAPIEATNFKLKFSMDNGETWETIADDISEKSYQWDVPTPRKNQKKYILKIIGHSVHGEKVGTDKLDKPISIEVVRITHPCDGEILISGNRYDITWEIHKTRNPVANTVLKYSKNDGKTWDTIETIEGADTRTFAWVAPIVRKEKSKCLVKVVLRDAHERKIGKDVSDGRFTIQP